MLFQRFQQNIKERFHLHLSSSKLILAVSGGVDSIVLTDLVARSGFDFVVAHCNFQLRGEESERDERFVRSLQNKYGNEVLTKKFETERYSTENKISIQEAARELRYKWFEELVNGQWSTINEDREEKIHHSRSIHLATAHHANDNIETLLINF